MGAVELTRLFTRWGHSLRFRRSTVVSWEDTKTANLIFVGSMSHALRALSTPRKYSLQRFGMADGRKANSIVNLQPGQGEPASFGITPSEPCCLTLTEDYAVIIYSKALGTGRYSLNMAGLTKMGTQAAVEFVCDSEAIEKLYSRLPQQGIYTLSIQGLVGC